MTELTQQDGPTPETGDLYEILDEIQRSNVAENQGDAEAVTIARAEIVRIRSECEREEQETRKRIEENLAIIEKKIAEMKGTGSTEDIGKLATELDEQRQKFALVYTGVRQACDELKDIREKNLAPTPLAGEQFLNPSLLHVINAKRAAIKGGIKDLVTKHQKMALVVESMLKHPQLKAVPQETHTSVDALLGDLDTYWSRIMDLMAMYKAMAPLPGEVV